MKVIYNGDGMKSSILSSYVCLLVRELLYCKPCSKIFRDREHVNASFTSSSRQFYKKDEQFQNLFVHPSSFLGNNVLHNCFPLNPFSVHLQLNSDYRSIIIGHSALGMKTSS